MRQCDRHWIWRLARPRRPSSDALLPARDAPPRRRSTAPSSRQAGRCRGLRAPRTQVPGDRADGEGNPASATHYLMAAGTTTSGYTGVRCSVDEADGLLHF